MHRLELIKKLPEDVVKMAGKGLYTLFVSNDNKILIAKDEVHVFSFSAISGNFLEIFDSSNFNISNFQRIHLTTHEQVQNLMKL